jgi:hypothetical protein
MNPHLVNQLCRNALTRFARARYAVHLCATLGALT